MKSKILVVGSINMDVVMTVEKLPARGQTVPGLAMQSFPGGKGANQAVALSLLGSPVTFLGCVGQDESGHRLINNLRESGVDTSSVHIEAATPTGTALIAVEESGENFICVYAGANSKLDQEKVRKHAELDKVSAVIASLEIPLEPVDLVLELAHKRGITTVLNPAPARELTNRIYQHVDFLIPNETELAQLSGLKVENLDDVRLASARLLTRGVKVVVSTLGTQGAYYYSETEQFHVPAISVQMVDATGAGDAFVAAFTSKITAGATSRQAVEFAALVGALTVTKPGAQNSLPSMEDVEDFAKRREVVDGEDV
jgi:ribokinase